MSYDVLVEELRAAARTLRSVTGPLAGYDFETSNVTAESFGHVELAEWFRAVGEQCDKAGTALRSGAEVLGDSLEYTATQYESTDEGVGLLFRRPLQSPFLDGTP
ncbi:hypothetical protein GCM10009844_09630 [Nocardioides koreensis]|uniref:Excreted virulence factor EspC (Type VII ESX diderm) n=1 Tax=Nocardioides koreensis TaxID=433651 RepID=A0ABP5L0R8_9ACTN